MEPSYVSVNAAQRGRLDALLDHVSDADLARRLPNGLSVGNVLVHLAFWDRYALSVLQEWEQSEFSESRTNFEAINAAVLMLASTIPDRTAAGMVREAAAAVDNEAAEVSPELAHTIIDNGKLRTLERGQHRREHLDQIERLLHAPTAI